MLTRDRENTLGGPPPITEINVTHTVLPRQASPESCHTSHMLASNRRMRRTGVATCWRKQSLPTARWVTPGHFTTFTRWRHPVLEGQMRPGGPPLAGSEANMKSIALVFVVATLVVGSPAMSQDKEKAGRCSSCCKTCLQNRRWVENPDFPQSASGFALMARGPGSCEAVSRA